MKRVQPRRLSGCLACDTRCALEYNCVRWGRRDLPPQASIGVFERSPDGLLAAVRVYDDVEAPAQRLRRHASVNCWPPSTS